MGQEEDRLTILYSPRAEAQLLDIWDWNAERYHSDHADDYLGFLRSRIKELTRWPERGRNIDGTLRRLNMLKPGAQDGHVAIYRFDEDALTIRILYIFHTKEDWQNKL